MNVEEKDALVEEAFVEMFSTLAFTKDEGKITEPFIVSLGSEGCKYFPMGSTKGDIDEWFDKEYSKGLSYLTDKYYEDIYGKPKDENEIEK